MSNSLILLVEDNKRDQELAKIAFRLCNISNEDLTIYSNGTDALNYLMNKPIDCLPKVVLLDLAMQKVDGLQVLKKIRQNIATRDIPVVILTSSNQEKDISECYQSGANSYIRKPISFEEFTEILQKLVEYWININLVPYNGAN